MYWGGGLLEPPLETSTTLNNQKLHLREELPPEENCHCDTSRESESLGTLTPFLDG